MKCELCHQADASEAIVLDGASKDSELYRKHPEWALTVPGRESPYRSRSVEEICRFIGADSLKFLSLPDLLKTVAGSGCQFCTGCFDGDYPIDPETGETTTEQVPYEYYILHVSLTNRDITTIAPEVLTAEQLQMFRVYLETSGNKPLLFGGGSADTSASEDLSGVQFVNGTRPAKSQAVIQ